MDVSIIIVNYNSSEMVVDCINSIYKHTSGVTYEVIVVDNASEEGSLQVLKDNFGDGIKLIESEVNLGFGKANNLGAEKAEGEYLFLLNPDTLLLNNAVKILCDYLEKNPEVGVAGGNLYSPDLAPTPSFCRTFDSIENEKKNSSWQKLIMSRVKTKLKIGSNKAMSEFNYKDIPEKVAYIFGADMMLKKSVFHKVGGFDRDFFMYGEEEELTYRITQLSLNVMAVPEAKIIHLEGATLNASHSFNARQFKMRMNGALTYFKKCFGDDGAEKFYFYRRRRYERNMKIAKLMGKLTPESAAVLQLKYLDEAYKEFTE